MESMSQIKGGLSHLERAGLEMGLPTSNDLIKKKKIPHRYTQPFIWVLVNSRYNQFDSQE